MDLPNISKLFLYNVSSNSLFMLSDSVDLLLLISGFISDEYQFILLLSYSQYYFYESVKSYFRAIFRHFWSRFEYRFYIPNAKKSVWLWLYDFWASCFSNHWPLKWSKFQQWIRLYGYSCLNLIRKFLWNYCFWRIFSIFFKWT